MDAFLPTDRRFPMQFESGLLSRRTRVMAALACCLAFLLVAGPGWSQHAVRGPPPAATPRAAHVAQEISAESTHPSTTPETPVPSPPQGQTSAPSVEDLVQRGVGRYPSVLALRRRLAAAREEVEPAGSLPDPMIGAMYQSVGKPWNPMGPMSMGQIEFTQPLYYPGKRAVRRRAAWAETSVRSAEVLDLQWAIATEIRSSYARIYALDRETESVGAAHDLVRTLGEAVAGRYAAGRAEQESVLKIELERFRLDERSADIVAERAGLVATLNRLAERETGEQFGIVRDLPTGLNIPPNVVNLALAGAPAVAVRRAAIQAARDRLEAAQLETRPNFLVGVSAGSTVDALPVFTARFGVEVPMWKGDKQEPMARAARLQLDAAQAELAATEAEIRAAAARLIARWERDNRQVERYEQAILPHTSSALHAATAAYVSGQGDFSNLIEDFELWLDARVSLAQRRAERFTTWAEVQALIGGHFDRSAR
jgi:outer membrane protein, heavy metal efflux system